MLKLKISENFYAFYMLILSFFHAFLCTFSEYFCMLFIRPLVIILKNFILYFIYFDFALGLDGQTLKRTLALNKIKTLGARH